MVFLCILVLLTIPAVSANKTPYLGGPDNNGGGKPNFPSNNISRNPFVVLAAYDDEMAASTHDFNGKQIDAQTYVEYQLKRAFYHFPFSIIIGGYETWISQNGLLLNETLIELMNAIDWHPCNYRNGKMFHLLVAFTGQQYSTSGGCYKFDGAAIVVKEGWVPDDNVVMHEVGHLFGLSHCRNHCVMNDEDKEFFWWYDEPLKPIETGVVTLWLAHSEYLAFMCYRWCSPHELQLLSVRFASENTNSITLALTGNGGRAFEEDTFKWEGVEHKYGTFWYETYLIYGGIIAIAAIIIAYLYFRRRRQRHK